VLETYALVVCLGNGENHAFKVAGRFGGDMEHEGGNATLFAVGAGHRRWTFGGGLGRAGCTAKFDVNIWAELVRCLGYIQSEWMGTSHPTSGLR
jgi:hypothetical protein